MSKFYIMVTDHRIAVASADTKDEIMKIYDNLSKYEGYKDKMIILERYVPKNSMGAPDCGQPALMERVGKYPFPDLDSIVDEEE